MMKRDAVEAGSLRETREGARKAGESGELLGALGGRSHDGILRLMKIRVVDDAEEWCED